MDDVDDDIRGEGIQPGNLPAFGPVDQSVLQLTFKVITNQNRHVYGIEIDCKSE